MAHRIPVTFQLYGKQAKGYLTEVDGMPDTWWLHSKGDERGLESYLIDVLYFKNKELRWRGNKKDLVEQMEVFREALVTWYQ